MCCPNGTRYIAESPISIESKPARAVSRRAEQILHKAVPAHKPKPVLPLIPVTKKKLKEAMGSKQCRVLLSAGTHGYRNASMVKLSNQMSRKARSTEKTQTVDLNVVQNHDVHSVVTMLCEIMRGKSDGAWAKYTRDILLCFHPLQNEFS